MKITRLCALFLLLAWPGQRLGAQPVGTTANVQVKATLVKPLVLTGLQSMNFGTILLSGPGGWTGALARISQAGGRTCGANLICSGAFQAARYRVSGTNKQTVSIRAPTVTLRNASDPSKTILLTLDAPPSLLLQNCGNPGDDFSVGGSISLSSSTADGLYSGTLAVTVDYN